MIQLLFNLYNFHEDWAYNQVAPFIKADMTVTVLPFSFAEGDITAENWQQFYGPNGAFYPEIIAPFKAFGIPESKITFINYFATTTSKLKATVEQSDIIFLTGGLPDQMMTRFKELAITDSLEAFKGVLIGSSAGAMVQLKNYHITPDADYDHFSYQEGLHLITDFGIEVHFEQSEDQLASIKRVLAETKTPVIYAMENAGGLIVQDNQLTPVGTVHLYS